MFLSLAQLRKEIAETTAANQWAQLNTGLDQWKQKYLYPFGDIAPILDSQARDLQAKERVHEGPLKAGFSPARS